MSTHLKKLICLILCFAQFSCVRYASQTAKTDIIKKEVIQSFLISEDGGTFVVAGTDSHYIFSLDKRLKAVLEWQGRQKITPSFSTFNVTPDQAVSGRFSLRIAESKIDQSEEQFLLQNGFKKVSTRFPHLVFTQDIEGKRYSSGGVMLPDSVSFSRPYQITFMEINAPGTRAAPIERTPLLVLETGEVILAGVVLIIICLVGKLTGGRCLPF